MQQHEFTLPYPPLQVRAGVLVVDGYGISLRVLYGKLRVEDGIADLRRSLIIDRAGSKLERLVIIGKTGTVTLEALAWLRAIGAAFVQIGSDGALLTQSVPFTYAGLPIRRAQALAVANGLGINIARDLILQKLCGQRANLVRLEMRDMRGFDRLIQAFDGATTIEEIRLIEAKAAAIYWNAWTEVPIQFKSRDLARIPARWARYDSRASILTGAPRAATNPVNALLNYLYSLAESEARLALLAAGLDPTLGVLHADQRNRDSFALDAMEVVRPDVDAFILDLLEDRVFTSRDFVELANGVCRLRAPMTHDLALTIPQWRMLVAPVVAHLAQAFRNVRIDATAMPDAKKLNSSRRGVATFIQSPLVATPRKFSQPRPYTSKAWTTPRPEALALTPVACASCGEPVIKRRRRYCDACLPEARRVRGQRAIAIARKALAAQTAAGNDPRASTDAGQKRGAANAEHHRRNREWKREHKASHDGAWFLREITPKLDALSLSEIAQTTGLSLAACSRFRAGTRVPHPRHWEAFLGLIGMNKK